MYKYFTATFKPETFHLVTYAQLFYMTLKVKVMAYDSAGLILLSWLQQCVFKPGVYRPQAGMCLVS